MPNSLGGEILLQTAAFSSLGSRRCGALAGQAVSRAHARGDVIFSEEGHAEGLVMLTRGVLRLAIRNAAGGSVNLREQHAPASIVTAGLLDGGPNGATAIAVTDCTTHLLPREPFMRLCRRNPEVSIRLLTELGTHLRRTSAFMGLVTAAGVYQRLARVLVDLLEETGNPEFALPCSQTELAGRLGTVRELIYRNLKALESKGVLRFSGKHIIVNDAQALVTAAGASAGGAHVFESHAAPPHPACFVLEHSRGIRDDDASGRR
jgi:CRP/FNR family transcriptional regulator